MDGNMTTPKRQHWVPRFYLRNFVAPDSNPKQEQVWIFHRKSGDPQLTSVNNIAVKKHLYSPKRPDGSRDPRLEKKLADLEGTISKLWPRLATDFVDLGSESIRKIIALFLSVQFLRHPERRDSSIEFRQRLIEFIEKQPFDSDGFLEIEQIQIGSRVYSVDKSDWPNYRNANVEDDTNLWRRMIEQDALNHARMLMKKRWSIVFIDEPLFVTSDYPIYVPEPELERFQIGASNAIVLFPISPTRVLCLDDLDEPGNQYYPIDNANADIYNLFTWVNTNDFMISPRPIYDVLAGIDRVRSEMEREMAGQKNGR